MALEPGTRLGHYEVLSSLGAGGMGEVYRAKDTKLGREVAIKLLLEEGLNRSRATSSLRARGPTKNRPKRSCGLPVVVAE